MEKFSFSYNIQQRWKVKINELEVKNNIPVTGIQHETFQKTSELTRKR